jgi:hypothetical protein
MKTGNPYPELRPLVYRDFYAVSGERFMGRHKKIERKREIERRRKRRKERLKLRAKGLPPPANT